jgi:hypothetical protein
MFRDFLKFSTSTIAAVVGINGMLFPFAQEFMEITTVPPYGNPKTVEMITSTICAVLLIAAFIHGSTYRVSFGLAFFAIATALAFYFGYQYAIGPNQAITNLGISDTVAADFGYPDWVLLLLYCGFFASFTCGFTLLLTYLFHLLRGGTRNYRY